MSNEITEKTKVFPERKTKDTDDGFMDALEESSDVDTSFMDALKDESKSDDVFMERLKQDKPLTKEEQNEMRPVGGSENEKLPEIGRRDDNSTIRENHALDGNFSPIENIIPRNGGGWEGEPGDSFWKPDRDKIPENPKTNPDGQTWGEILDEFGIEGIPFKDGEPDFSDVAKGEVEIEDFSEDRADNFDAADEALAKQRGCTKEEVREWRKENGYTWHECSDMKTMQKVPTKVHGNVPHSGGISEKKKENGNG
jgi:hypothetical protein